MQTGYANGADFECLATGSISNAQDVTVPFFLVFQLMNVFEKFKNIKVYFYGEYRFSIYHADPTTCLVSTFRWNNNELNHTKDDE
jgi:hypothetical protein